jgi:DNA primase
VDLKRAGTGSWKGLCPFHAEKTPSFHVHEQRQFFHCFGCGEKGDVFSFLIKIEQRSFMDVVGELAQHAGVDIPEATRTLAERQAAIETESERAGMMRAIEIATSFFQSQLLLPSAQNARAYLEHRSISPSTQARFRIGFAPPSWDALQKHLAQEKVQLDVAVCLGLVGTNDRGRYDFFRDRIMLPVLDRQKRPIGFSSRLLDPDAKERKYVNSPDSPLFHKKENLYGLHAALDAIRRTGTAIVVEGNFDVLTLHDKGIEEAVAPMGTALTVEQIKLLGRAAKRIVVVFDGDGAGSRAAEKAVPTAAEAGLFFAEADSDGRVAEMPPGLDPDDFVRTKGPEAFRALVDNARPMLDHLIQCAANDATIPGKAHTAKRVAEVLAHLRNPLMRDLYVRDLAAKLGVPVQQIVRTVHEAGHRERPAAVAAPVETSMPIQPLPPREEIEAFALLATHPELASSDVTDRVHELLRNEAIRTIFTIALESLRSGARPDIPAWLDHGAVEIRDLVSASVMDGRWEKVEMATTAMLAMANKLERMRVDAELAEAQQRHREASLRGDEEAVRAISLREMELIRTKLGLANQSRGMTT